MGACHQKYQVVLYSWKDWQWRVVFPRASEEFLSFSSKEFKAKPQRQTCPTSLVKLQWLFPSKWETRSCTCRRNKEQTFHQDFPDTVDVERTSTTSWKGWNVWGNQDIIRWSTGIWVESQVPPSITFFCYWSIQRNNYIQGTMGKIITPSTQLLIIFQ